jgi:hypothetical protein
MNYQQLLHELRATADLIIASDLPEKEKLLVDLLYDMARLETKVIAALAIGWVTRT